MSKSVYVKGHWRSRPTKRSSKKVKPSEFFIGSLFWLFVAWFGFSSLFS